MKNLKAIYSPFAVLRKTQANGFPNQIFNRL